MKILILFGPPFSGKGTQGKILAQRLGYNHISTGDILRKEKEMNSELGVIAQEYSKKGLLAPDDVLEKLVEKELKSNRINQGIILDGYPRTLSQAETLFQLCDKYGVQMQKVVFLKVSTPELIIRGIERGKTSAREDDKNPEVIQKRIEVYHSETKPVAAFYSKLNLVLSLEGEGEIEQIADRIMEEVRSA
jgi:adenylate kinase